MGNTVHKSAQCIPFFSDTSFLPCSIKKTLQCHEPSKYEKTFSRKKDKLKIALPVNLPIFPPEIITEILSWLPVKDLVKLQLVCKQWHAIVQDRHFVEMHMNRGTRRKFWNKKTTPSTSETFQLICGCDGLLLQKSNATRKYCIKNLTTSQVLELPDPHKTKLAMTFNYVKSTREYKLVSVHDDEADNTGAFCEVLTVAKDNSWRSLKLDNIKDLGKKRERTSVVSADSVVHCLQIWKIGSQFSLELVSLDLETECFNVKTLTNELYSVYPDWEKVSALNWCGKLAFAHVMNEDLQVLVLEDYKKHKWSERKTLVLPWEFMNKNGYQKGDLAPLFAESDTLWFWLKDKIIFSYNMKTGCTGDSCPAPEGCKIGKAFCHIAPSIVTFKGMKPEKRLLNQQG